MKFDKIYQFWDNRNGKISLLASLVVLFLGLIKLPIDPDLGWHIRQGELIVANRQFIHSDQLSYTMTNYPWAPYWVLDIVVFIFAKAEMLSYLSVVFALIAAMAVVLIIVALGFSKPRLAAFLVLVDLILLYTFAGVRIQIVSWLFLAIIYLLLLFKKYRKPAELVIYLPLFILWANFHFGFLLGLSMIGLALATEVLELSLRYLKLKSTKDIDLRDSLRLGSILAASVLACLINPNGFGLFRSAYGFLGSKVNTENIAEWLPLNFRSDIGFATVLLLAAILFLVFKNFKRLTFFEIASFAFLALSALTSIRNLPYFLIVMTAITLRSEINFRLSESQLFRFLKGVYLPIILIGIAIVLLWQSVQVLKTANDIKSIADKGNYPYDAVVFLNQNLPEGNMFNEYNWGGYLIWQLPQKKTFIDGRMPGWATKDRDILTDFLKIYKVSEKTTPLLDKYQVSFAILSPEAPITAYLKLAGWQQVYNDKTAVVLKRKN